MAPLIERLRVILERDGEFEVQGDFMGKSREREIVRDFEVWSIFWKS